MNSMIEEARRGMQKAGDKAPEDASTEELLNAVRGTLERLQMVVRERQMDTHHQRQ